MRTTHFNRTFLTNSLHLSVSCIILSCFSSCSFFYPNKMLKTPKDYQFAELSEPTLEYKFVPGDQFEMFVFSNNADKLVDPILVSAGIAASEANPVSLRYEIDSAGSANLPVIGATHLAGQTETEAMQFLQGLYAEHYINPYVNLFITNKRFTVYRGNLNAMVIPISNKNMTIAEAIGAAGGLSATGKAKEVKIARQHADSLQLSIIDLSTIEGIQQANKMIQPNDIIYIESNINSEFIKEITPIISTLSSLVLVYIYLKNLNNP